MNVCYAFIHDLIHHDNQFHQIDYFNYDIEVFKGNKFYHVDNFHQDVQFHRGDKLHCSDLYHQCEHFIL